MLEPKPLSADSIPAAIEKAERYRLLNEPLEAESICVDVLDADPNNQEALAILLLALTDQFPERLDRNFAEAREVLERFEDEYSKLYYGGIIAERRAKCSISRGGPGSGYVAYDWLHQAMEKFEQAAEIRPAGNDDAILRWNTCARIINRNPDVVPEPEVTEQQMLE